MGIVEKINEYEDIVIQVDTDGFVVTALNGKESYEYNVKEFSKITKKTIYLKNVIQMGIVAVLIN